MALVMSYLHVDVANLTLLMYTLHCMIAVLLACLVCLPCGCVLHCLLSYPQCLLSRIFRLEESLPMHIVGRLVSLCLE